MNCIALVRVSGLDRYDLNSVDYNIGLRYLDAIAIKNGINCDIFDPYQFDLDKGRIILKNRYYVVGFYIHILNTEESLKLAELIKQKQPETYIIMGGPHASATANELLEDNASIDAVCCGDGEDVMNQITKKVKNYPQEKVEMPKGILRYERFRELNKLPFPSVPEEHDTARISTSRGCPYSCEFCTTPQFYDSGLNSYIYLTAENIYGEMR